ncbi:transglycosylase SLT domain-containing protein [Rudanella paleaurantiibacter]|uniref:Transglycosylase SLT domain-containing protein n=1 Tax=Rudanella paleaurantiibacter TaxID=2614655 RepID=A0A7J5TVU9_9BACT|nr:transglycosylase SLT domain-containing protein [Rudanella paleaurantiibacter]KAB7728424.1 transglycosylase SLT domain-containing protein [Rudanella paleaurantiibacter]
MALVYDEMVLTDRATFERRVRQIANRFGFNPNWLMVVMRFESAGTFRPNVKNPYSGAVGLIQFTSSTAASLGTTTAALASMTAVKQLDYVERYFERWNITGKVTSLDVLYFYVFAPAYATKPLSYTAYAKGTTAYSQNAALDRNKDGKITLEEIAWTIRQYDRQPYPDGSSSAGINSTTGLLTVATLAGGFYLWKRKKYSAD